MDSSRIEKLLMEVSCGDVSVADAMVRLRHLPYEALDQAAHVDHHRHLRCGMPEVIYGQGKTIEQTVDIFRSLAVSGQDVLVTRTTEQVFSEVKKDFPAARWEAPARAIVLKQQQRPVSQGTIAIVSAGTSDIPVAEEARVTAELFDQKVKAIYDVGVAGLHRLVGRLPELQQAQVLIVVAGMEGALASVVAGLVAAPVIAVPTSVGYGASFQGVAALLAMLNSCASSVSVVNIDNGFSAGCIAAKINRLADGPAGAGHHD